MRCALLLALALWLSACAAAPPAGARTVDEVRTIGSLRGTDLDGDWVLGRLQPDIALIRRFDHLLTTLGEVDLPELRRWIEREVTQQRDAVSASQVLIAWDEHLAVLQGQPTPSQQAAGNPYPINEPSRAQRRSIKPAPVPRSLLTPEPPADTDAAQALHTQRVQTFGTAAAERLRSEDAARWAWAQRLAQARAQLPSIGNALPAQEAWLARQFSGNELLRARTLLGLPP